MAKLTTIQDQILRAAADGGADGMLAAQGRQQLNDLWAYAEIDRVQKVIPATVRIRPSANPSRS